MNDRPPLPSVSPSRRSPASIRRRRVFAVVLAVLSFVLLFAFGEIATRLFAPFSNPGMHNWPAGYFTAESPGYYHQTPDFPPTWMHQLSGRRNLVYANALGMRDIPVPPPAPGQIRILVIGCSMSEGMAIEDPSQPWPRQLEAALNANPPVAGKKCVVMNGGVAGFNCFQAIRRGLELDPQTKPDAWILNYYSEQWYRNVYGPGGQYDWIWGNMFNRDSFEQIYPPGSLRRGLSDWSMLSRRLLFKYTPLDSAHSPVAIPFHDLESASRAAIESFKSEAGRLGRPAFLAYLSHLPDLDKHITGGHNDIYPLVEKIANDANFPILDPTPEMVAYKREHAPKATFAELWGCGGNDMHYLPEANHLYGQALARQLAPELQKRFGGAPPASNLDGK